MNKELRNSLLSFFIIAALVTLIYFSMIFGSESKLSFIWLYITWYIGVVISFIAAIYYMWNYKAVNQRRNKSFTYNFAGTLNWISGITGILLAEGAGLWLIAFMLNCVIGFYIYKDIFTTTVVE